MMLKYRVHEVAKDLNVPNKFVLDVLQKYCNETKKHMTALTEEELDLVLESFTQSHQAENFDAYFADNQPEAPKAEENTSPRAEVEEKKTEESRKQNHQNTNNNKKGGRTANGQQQGQKRTDNRAKQQPQQKAAQPQAKAAPAPQKQPAVQQESNTVQKPAGRLVDTRASHVDIERYNEKYDRLASEKVRTDNTVQKQKITQKSQRSGKPRTSRKETEA